MVEMRSVACTIPFFQNVPKALGRKTANKGVCKLLEAYSLETCPDDLHCGDDKSHLLFLCLPSPRSSFRSFKIAQESCGNSLYHRSWERKKERDSWDDDLRTSRSLVQKGTMATSSTTSSGNEKNERVSQQGKTPAWTLTNADQPGVALVTSPLIGSNYIAWSLAFRTALEAKRKIGFINGTILKPTDSDMYEIWKPIDSMVKSWLTSSISKEISESLIHCDSALALWKELEERFGTSCGPQLYHIQREMVTTEQGTNTVTKYWNRLHKWWDEWTRLSPSPRCHCGKCTCEVNKRLEEKESSSRLMQFLMGLSQSFDALRGQILNLDPMPAVNRAYNMAIQLERQREVNLNYGGNSLGTNISEGAEMVMLTKGARNEGNRRRETKEEKYAKYCEHCHMNGHLKDTCFKLQGYPDWYKDLKKKNPNIKKPSHLAATIADSPLEVPLIENGDQGNHVSVLSMLVKELSKAMKGGASESVNFAQLGNFAGNMNDSNKNYRNSWIVDTGASSHICYKKSIMHDIKPLPKTLKMHLPTGHTVNVLETGSVRIKAEIELTNVLYIPSFKYNLLSVNRLAKDLNMNVIFDSQQCLIQDLKTRRILAKGKVDGNLYLLDNMNNGIETSLKQHCNSVTMCKTNIWHNRLGHCPFAVLKQIENKAADLTPPIPLPSNGEQQSEVQKITEQLNDRDREAAVGNDDDGSETNSVIEDDVEEATDLGIQQAVDEAKIASPGQYLSPLGWVEQLRRQFCAICGCGGPGGIDSDDDI
ncbi:Retrovirus-related Pol polyprotein from transposon TNT 1-94 [Senna tora]|uniref:Retrovirus-related Pol polyprotein from transposon TNT 1-94 n=1 Tax=Senna tora TaxID=362788 RepID=A0A834XHX0_9FABA|nr:Retrovirus-related Pol polyprotein from transposon TNT 1-94 [Senna tora]